MPEIIYYKVVFLGVRELFSWKKFLFLFLFYYFCGGITYLTFNNEKEF